MTSNLQWPDFLRIAAALQPQRYNIGALLRDVDNRKVVPMGDVLVLPFRHLFQHRAFLEELESTIARKALEALVSQAFGKPMSLRAVWLEA